MSVIMHDVEIIGRIKMKIIRLRSGVFIKLNLRKKQSIAVKKEFGRHHSFIIKKRKGN
jgi:hypothetical protein